MEAIRENRKNAIALRNGSLISSKSITPQDANCHNSSRGSGRVRVTDVKSCAISAKLLQAYTRQGCDGLQSKTLLFSTFYFFSLPLLPYPFYFFWSSKSKNIASHVAILCLAWVSLISPWLRMISPSSPKTSIKNAKMHLFWTVLIFSTILVHLSHWMSH